jgi:hypothetical protein
MTPGSPFEGALKKGMYADWNECLKYIDTDFFYFLTSDDTCYPQLVSTTTKALDAYPDIDVCHFNFNYIDETGQVTKTPKEITQEQCGFYSQVNEYAHIRDGLCEFFMHFAYRAIYTTITALVFRHRLIEQLQGFKTTCGPIGDYDWTMRMGLFSNTLFIPEILATWRLYGEQATRQTTRLAAAERLLQVAQENLTTYGKSSLFCSLKRPLNTKALLQDFHQRCAAGLVASLTSRGTTVPNRLIALLELGRRYPPLYS